jgi:hypothetical protein
VNVTGGEKIEELPSIFAPLASGVAPAVDVAWLAVPARARRDLPLREVEVGGA